MGLIKHNYLIEDLSVEIPTAYAICIDISSHKHGNTEATFGIFTSREDAFGDIKFPIKCDNIVFEADKTTPLWEQAYIEAKEQVFTDWEDDIVDD